MKPLRLLLPIALLAAAAACGKDRPTEPVEGKVLVHLNSPNTHDGAVLLRITGPVTAVRAVAPLQAASTTAGAVTRVVVTGDIGSGPILELTIPDQRELNSYLAFVEQAASRLDYALLDVGGYVLSLSLQPR
jgi:hypothetical protein